MTDSLKSLKHDASRDVVKTSELLKRTKMLLGNKIEEEVNEWIEKELNGYGEKDVVPKYRVLAGEPKGWNPVNGWIPFMHHDAETQELLSQRSVSQSVAELETLVGSSESKVLQIPYPAEQQKLLSESVEFTTNFTLFISQNSVYGILNTVRNRLIDFLQEQIDEGDHVESTDADEDSEKTEKAPTYYAAAGGGGGGGSLGGRGGDGGSVIIGIPPDEVEIGHVKNPHRQYRGSILKGFWRWVRDHIMATVITGVAVAIILAWIGVSS